MTFNKFMSIFKLFIDEDSQDNKIEIASYTIHYNKPSIYYCYCGIYPPFN